MLKIYDNINSRYKIDQFRRQLVKECPLDQDNWNEN